MRRSALAGTSVALLFATGCGGNTSNVEAELTSYFTDGTEVSECFDQHYTKDGLDLYQCVVYPQGGNKAARYDVVINDQGRVVGASPH